MLSALNAFSWYMHCLLQFFVRASVVAHVTTHLPQTKDEQSSQLSLPQQDDHNIGQNPLNTIRQQTGQNMKPKSPSEWPRGHTKRNNTRTTALELSVVKAVGASKSILLVANFYPRTLIRLCTCAGRSGPSLSTYAHIYFSLSTAHVLW